MLRDIELMSRHPYLTICARDIHSFEVLKKNFKNTILLVPDMAFVYLMRIFRSICNQLKIKLYM